MGKKDITALLALLVGSLGAHKFYMGYTQEGVITLLVSFVGSFFTFGLSMLIMWIIGIIEAVTYFKMSEEEFQATYIDGNRAWF